MSKSGVVVAFIASLLGSPDSKTDMYVADYRDPNITVADLRAADSTCLDDILDRMEESGCERLFRWNSGDIVYKLTCTTFESSNDTVETGFKIYNLVHWRGVNINEEFKLPYEEEHCKDDTYHVYSYEN
tara:strand:+ start:565 stop:951 length:387 start_codon:yes stop_codon:yes gene_type:complete